MMTPILCCLGSWLMGLLVGMVLGWPKLRTKMDDFVLRLECAEKQVVRVSRTSEEYRNEAFERRMQGLADNCKIGNYRMTIARLQRALSRCKLRLKISSGRVHAMLQTENSLEAEAVIDMVKAAIGRGDANITQCRLALRMGSAYPTLLSSFEVATIHSYILEKMPPI